MEKKKLTPLYRLIEPVVRWVYPKIEYVGLENMPQQPALFIGNHAQNNGPLSCQLYFPRKKYIWTAGQMLHLKEVPAYAFQDFWSFKPKRSRWLFKIASYLIAPLSVCIFTNADTIAVYRDSRGPSTFKKTIRALCDGANIVIFPEHNVKRSNIIYDFQSRFIDVARLYHKKTGKSLPFVPMYVAPRLKKVYLGKPTFFRADVPLDEERERIRQYLMMQIETMACALPTHTVVPYRNIPRKDYPVNSPLEVFTHEETRS